MHAFATNIVSLVDIVRLVIVGAFYHANFLRQTKIAIVVTGLI